MGKILKPDEVYARVEDIALEKLWEKGIRGLILDLDNTIVPWGEDIPPQKIVEFVQKAKDIGFRLAIISNAQPRRVARCGEILEIPGIGLAKKPFPSSLKKAQKDLLHLPSSKVAIVGDQIFTDIVGGNLLGFYTILVEPITRKDFIGTKLFRFFERIFHLR